MPEQYGADIVFKIGNSAQVLEALRKAIVAINAEMLTFTERAKAFNKSIGKLSNIENLITTLERLQAKRAREVAAQEREAKATENASKAKKEFIRTILRENKLLDDSLSLQRKVTTGLDKNNRVIAVAEDAKGKLLNVRIRDVKATQAQIRAQEKLNAQQARATSEYNRLIDLRNQGALKQLSIERTLNTATGRTTEKWRGLTAEGKRFNATITRVNGKLQAVSGTLPTLDQSLQGTRRNIGQITLSWQSMIRIFTVQTLHRALSSFIAQVKEATRVAVDFGIKIAEVQTISQQNQLSTSEWSKGLRELSDSFGIDVLNQTEAAYQTLSNQIVHGAKTLEFLKEANRLAIITVSDTASSVNFLSSAINAFGKTSEDAADITDKTFKIIELGRVRLQEMATTFGQIAVPAKLLNISFSELGAAITVMTRRGIPFNEQQTLLRNVMLSLIKPTKEMKKVLHSLGATSGEEAIRVRGFREVLAAVEEQSKGTLTGIGKLFRRIRGTVGGGALFAGAGLKAFARDLNQIQHASESAGNAFQIVMQNSSKQVELEVNKIKNFFTVDLAGSVVEALASVNKSFISLTTIVKGFTNFLEAGMVVAITLTINAIRNLVIAIRAGSITLNPYVLAISAAAVAAGVLKTALDALADSYEEQAKAIEDARIATEKQIRYQNIALVNSTFAAFRQASNIIDRAVANARAQNFKLVEAQLEVSKAIANNIRLAYNTVNKEISNGIRTIGRELQNANKVVDTATQKIFDLQRQISEKQFAITLSGVSDPAKQIALIKQRLQSLQAQVKVPVGIDAASIKKSEVVFQQISDLLDLLNQKQKQFILGTDKEKSTREKILKLSEKITQLRQKQNIDQLRGIDKIRKAATDLQPVYLKSSKDRLEVETRNQKAIIANQARLKKIAVDEAKINALIAQRNELQKQLQESEQAKNAIGSKGFDIQKSQLSLLQQQFEFQKKLRELAAKEAAEKAKELEDRKRAFNDLQTSFADLQAISIPSITGEVDLTKQKKALTDALNTVDTFSKKLEEKRQLISDTNRINFEEKLQARREQLQKLLLANERQQRLNMITEQNKLALAQNKIRERELLSQLNAADQRIANVKAALKSLVETSIIRTGGTSIPKELKAFLDAPSRRSLDKLSEVLKQFIFNKQFEPGATLGREELIKFLNTLLVVTKQRQSLEDQRKVITDANKKILESVKNSIKEFSPKAIMVQQLTENQQQTIALNQIVELLRPRRPVKRAFGGTVGTDSIPALLSPGEFVVNAQATRKFYSQLVAMNSGVQRFSSGGPVTNVGDINVTLQSSGNESYDVRKIGKLLRREIRRGTVKL